MRRPRFFVGSPPSEGVVLLSERDTHHARDVLRLRDGDGVVVVVPREGEFLGTMGEQGGYWEPALSHDGSRVAVALGFDAGDIWIYDLERDTRTRFTFDAADDRQPLWSPDDEQLAFSSGKTAVGEIWVRPTSGQGEAELLFTADTNIILTDWAADGLLPAELHPRVNRPAMKAARSRNKVL